MTYKEKTFHPPTPEDAIRCENCGNTFKVTDTKSTKDEVTTFAECGCKNPKSIYLTPNL